jgi:hypothetical protein
MLHRHPPSTLLHLPSSAPLAGPVLAQGVARATGEVAAAAAPAARAPSGKAAAASAAKALTKAAAALRPLQAAAGPAAVPLRHPTKGFLRSGLPSTILGRAPSTCGPAEDLRQLHLLLLARQDPGAAAQPAGPDRPATGPQGAAAGSSARAASAVWHPGASALLRHRSGTSSVGAPWVSEPLNRLSVMLGSAVPRVDLQHYVASVTSASRLVF